MGILKLLPMTAALIMLAALRCLPFFGLKATPKDTAARIAPQGSPEDPKAPRLRPDYSSHLLNLSNVFPQIGAGFVKPFPL